MSVETVKPRPARRAWRRHGPLLFSLLVVWFLSITLPQFIPHFGDPEVPQTKVAHGALGILALTTGVLQVWPWLRRRRPRAHRLIGRVYVFGGVVPAGLLVYTVLIYHPKPHSSITWLWTTLWLGSTLAGYLTGRKKDWVAHRRWMLYSVALTFVASTGTMVLALTAGTGMLSFEAAEDLVNWFPWVVHLAIAHWVATRTGIGGLRRPSPRVPDAAVAAAEAAPEPAPERVAAGQA